MDDPSVTLLIVASITVAANVAIAIADVLDAPFVRANAAEVGVPATWLPTLGALKVAGAVGIVVGLVWLPAVGVAASVGLIMFFVGAVVAHVRAGVLHNVAFPGAFLGLAIATLALAI